MGRLAAFVMGIVAGAVLVFGAQRYHVVTAKDGTYLIPKASASFSECYVDIRNFTVADWNNHKSLAAAIVMAKKEHLLQDTAAESFRNNIRSAIEHLADEFKGDAPRR